MFVLCTRYVIPGLSLESLEVEPAVNPPRERRMGFAHMRGAGVMREQIMCATGDLTDSCARPSFGRFPCAAHCAGLREAAPCTAPGCAKLRHALRPDRVGQQ